MALSTGIHQVYERLPDAPIPSRTTLPIYRTEEDRFGIPARYGKLIPPPPPLSPLVFPVGGLAVGTAGGLVVTGLTEMIASLAGEKLINFFVPFTPVVIGGLLVGSAIGLVFYFSSR